MKEYFLIKDTCRKGLIKYLEAVFRRVPKATVKNILDVGCGTGVPALCLAGHFPGSITSIDIDSSSLAFFQEKILATEFQSRINIKNVSFFDLNAEQNSFDLILAEGFLNVVGFERGFKKVADLLKPGGYFIIHDEVRDHDKKVKFMEENRCKPIDSLYLNEAIWWNDYYQMLDATIKEINDAELFNQFQREIKEIESYKKDPGQFTSIYYVVVKSG